MKVPFPTPTLKKVIIVSILPIDYVKDRRTDCKYTFIRHRQNIRRHNELSEYRLYGGRHRKHWIETPIS